MNYLRKIINSEDIETLFDLPEELRNKKLEVLISPIEEEKEVAVENEDEDEFNPDDFRGVLNKNEDELKEELEVLRNEWDRL